MTHQGQKRHIRIGMAGYKFMGKAHSHAYRDLPFYFDLPAVPVMQAIAGRNEAAVSQAAQQWGWASYETDWRRLIERDDIDAIDIGTPNDTHYDIAIAAIRAGKHVVCEKPLALTVEQARRMRDEAEQAGVVHMICHNYRFAPAVQFARQLIADGRLGRIYHIRATYLQDWLSDPQAPAGWKSRKAVSGSGALGDIGAHIIDLARFLVGEFAEVTALLETFVKERPAETPGQPPVAIDVDDTAAFLARFDNGAVGTFEATRFAKGNRNGNRFEINGSLGSIRWDLENMNNLQIYFENETDLPGTRGFRTINCTEAVHPYASNYWPAGHIIGYEHTFMNLLSEFIRGIADHSRPKPDFNDGLRNQLALDAVERSAASRRWEAVERE